MVKRKITSLHRKLNPGTPIVPMHNEELHKLYATRVYPKVSGLSRNEINDKNKHSLRSNRKGYGGKTHYTDSQNSDTTTPSFRELYHLQFSLQEASPETCGYTLEFE
jgi:hypothetical protein